MVISVSLKSHQKRAVWVAVLFLTALVYASIRDILVGILPKSCTLSNVPLDRVQLAYDSPPAVNMVSGEVFKHHAVFQRLHALRETYPVQRDVLTELNGILVPAEFDCDIFNNNSRWGTHPYFWSVPSRWYACRLHHANLLSGLRPP